MECMELAPAMTSQLRQMGRQASRDVRFGPNKIWTGAAFNWVSSDRSSLRYDADWQLLFFIFNESNAIAIALWTVALNDNIIINATERNIQCSMFTITIWKRIPAAGLKWWPPRQSFRSQGSLKVVSHGSVQNLKKERKEKRSNL